VREDKINLSYPLKTPFENAPQRVFRGNGKLLSSYHTEESKEKINKKKTKSSFCWCRSTMPFITSRSTKKLEAVYTLMINIK